MVFPFKKTLILLSLAAAGYVFGLATLDERAHVHEAQAAQPADDGEGTPPAPDFTLADIVNGGKVTLSDHKGKWVFLNFWATWCGPCVYEMPMMNTFYKSMKKKGMVMLAVSVDEGSPAMVKNFAKQLKLDFTILHDPDNAVMKRYGVRTIPRTYVVDPDGNIQAGADGMRDWDSPEMLNFFQALMQDFEKKKETRKQDASPKKAG